MERKIKGAIGLGVTGGVVLFTTTLLLKQSTTVKIIATVLGVAAGAACGYFLIKDEEISGTGEVSADTKKNRTITFTKV
jgi:hypothetical protein